ncbi:phosphotransferase family protein [Planomonospora sp. ID82291]|uniref:phosphotransferase family protein n=1 Tax=Planomonospora sp. ID82291 TaxID=2738136 RepID=UPI0018C3AA16|nr:phosphotransferase [Planomonospora sp. ID82291]MBG0812786.1 phosphotransferase [Planomonospora sp. ID82291]
MEITTQPIHPTPEKATFTADRPALDEISAVRQLITCGALSPEQAIDSRLTIMDESRRCRCLIVRFESGGWAVKQGTTAETGESIRQEAMVYQALKPTTFAHHLPEFLSYDEDRGLLVIEYVVGESPREAYTAERERRAAIAVSIGAALARLHRIDGDLGLMPKPAPPILRCGYPTPASVEFHSRASLQIIQAIQSNEALMSVLNSVRAQWTPEVITHNDLRGDNIIIRESGEPVFIDWEMGGPGDRRWDIAGLLAERLVWWLTDPDFWVPNNPSETANEAAAIGMKEIREFSHSFLGSYLTNFSGTLDLGRAGLSGLMTWCAARLVQFAIENTHQRSVPLATSRQLLQIAANIRLNPDVAARTFFGLALNDVND